MTNMEKAINENRRSGNNWFDIKSGKRIESPLMKNGWFVTSDDTEEGGRGYSVRKFSKHYRDVDTVGKTGMFETLEDAVAEINRILGMKKAKVAM